MSEADKGMLVLCVTAVVVSAASHAIIHRYALASVVASVVWSVLFLCYAYIMIGYLGPFFPIAFVVGGAYSFGIALVVGIPYRVRRRKSPPGHCPDCRYNLTGNESGICPECGRPITE